MKSYSPTNKVTYGVAAGAGITILIWALNQWVGITVPGEVQGAFQVIAVFATQWWVPDQPKG